MADDWPTTVEPTNDAHYTMFAEVIMRRASLLLAIFITFTSSSAFADGGCIDAQSVAIEIGQLAAFGVASVPVLFAPEAHVGAGLGAAMDGDSSTPVLLATGGRAHGWFAERVGYGALMQSVGAYSFCSMSIASHLGAGLELHGSLSAVTTLYGMLGPQVAFLDDRLWPGGVVAVGVLYDGAFEMSAELRYLPTVTREQVQYAGTSGRGSANYDRHLQNASTLAVQVNPGWTWSPFLQAEGGFTSPPDYYLGGGVIGYAGITAGLAYHN